MPSFSRVAAGPGVALALTAAVLLGVPAAAEGLRTPLEADPALAELTLQALQARPELQQAEALLDVARARVPQQGGLQDPMFSVGLQNDGFQGLQIGVMPQSYVSLGLSQTLPWPEKPALREAVAEVGVALGEAQRDRLRLDVRAQVQRTYVDLLLVRDRLGLLDQVDVLWGQSAALTRVRYEAGDGAQSDLLRAQLEVGRLQRKRLQLRSLEAQTLAALNWLRGQAPDAPFATTRGLASLADPELDLEPPPSPEVQQAGLLGLEAERRGALTRKELLPDLTVSLGLMLRGPLEPMWQVGLGFPIPSWSVRRQQAALGEYQARARAQASARTGAEALVARRRAERRAALQSLVATNRLHRSGLLVQSEATVTSTLAQYQVGKVTFASVLDALKGYLDDVEASLESFAAAQQVAIAERAGSLDPPAGLAPVSSPQGDAPPMSGGAPSKGM